MPALAAISASTILTEAQTLLTGSATVGIDTTLSPDGLAAPGVQRWANRSGGIQVGYPTLTIGVRKPTRDSRLTRVSVKVNLPTLATTAPTTATGIQPVPQASHHTAVIMEFFLPERGTEAERLVLFSLLRSLFASTINASDANPTDVTGSPLLSVVKNCEPIWGS